MADPALRRAYLAFFVPQYAAKVALLVDQLSAEGLMRLPQRPRVLDVGAGPLTGLFGAWLHAGPLGDSVALDLAGRAMEAGRRIFDAVEREQPIRLVEQPVQQRPLPAGTFDLVVVAHVLNELGDPRRALSLRVGLVRALLGMLAPGGRVLIVEPGTRVHGRSLMAVRDALWSSAAVLSPCRGVTHCPLLSRAGNWCHGDVLWARPPQFFELERASGLRKDELKESHLLLARAGEAEIPTTGLRLVGGLMTDVRGVERRYGCGRAGLEVLTGAPRLPAEARDLPRHGLLDPVTLPAAQVRSGEGAREALRPSAGPPGPRAPRSRALAPPHARGPRRPRRP